MAFINSAETLYLHFPSAENKSEWIAYAEEYRTDAPNDMPLGYSEKTPYDEWLRKINDNRHGLNLPVGIVPSTVFFLMQGKRILGHISIRHNIDSPFLSLYGGHIGYGVRPSERRRGFATKMLSLALIKCKELDLVEVMVTCKKDNIGSAKTITNNGGLLVDEIFSAEENCLFQRYTIVVR